MRAAVLSPTRTGRDRHNSNNTINSSSSNSNDSNNNMSNDISSNSPDNSNAVVLSIPDNAGGMNDKEKLKKFVAKAMQQQTRTAFHKALDTDTSDDDGGED